MKRDLRITSKEVDLYMIIICMINELFDQKENQLAFDLIEDYTDSFYWRDEV